MLLYAAINPKPPLYHHGMGNPWQGSVWSDWRSNTHSRRIHKGEGAILQCPIHYIEQIPLDLFPRLSQPPVSTCSETKIWFGVV